MLHTETTAPETFLLLKELMDEPFLNGFILVGGTALSLQIGHRISVDLDLFSEDAFDPAEIGELLKDKFDFTLDFLGKGTLRGEIAGVQIDCLRHQYPWLAPSNKEDHIRLASLADIAAMKLNAIVGNGTRLKDFIDIAFLSSKMSLNEMLEAYEKKYQNNAILAFKSLIYFEEIDFSEPIKIIKEDSFSWENTKKKLLAMVANPSAKF